MKVGILAAGNIANTMARTLAPVKGIDVIAVASRKLDTAQEFAKKHNIPKAYGSYLELAQDPEIDLIYIATPHSHHYENIKMCLENNKHILCEKAFTVNAKQAEEVLKIAEEKNLLLTEAIWPRYQPSRKIIEEIVKSGIIGTPKVLTANLGFEISKVPRIFKPELAGGALLDCTIYPITFMLMHFGNDFKDVKAVATYYETGVDSADSLTFIYPDGRSAILYATTEALTDSKASIAGTQGYLEVDNVFNPKVIEVYDLSRRLVLKRLVPEQITGYEYEVIEIADCLKKGLIECPSMPHKETIFVMKLMDSIREQINVHYPGLE